MGQGEVAGGDIPGPQGCDGAGGRVWEREWAGGVAGGEWVMCGGRCVVGFMRRGGKGALGVQELRKGAVACDIPSQRSLAVEDVAAGVKSVARRSSPFEAW